MSFETENNVTGFGAVGLDGDSRTIGSTSVTLYQMNENNDALFCSGTTVPSAGESGYAKGAIFWKTDDADGTKGVYFNYGTNSDAAFDRISHDSQAIWLQGDSELDLTSTSSTAKFASNGDSDSARGADVVTPIEAYARVTTQLASDSTAPKVKIQDSNGNDAGITMDTFADSDSVGVIRYKKLSDGTDVTAVDLTSEGLRAKVSTAAADSGTAAGNCKVAVKALLWK